jgi:hypothetical protein
MCARSVLLYVITLCGVLFVSSQSNATCMQNDMAAFNKCIIVSAYNSCDDRMKPSEYTKCFQKAVVKAVNDSGKKGMRGEEFFWRTSQSVSTVNEVATLGSARARIPENTIAHRRNVEDSDITAGGLISRISGSAREGILTQVGAVSAELLRVHKRPATKCANVRALLG